MYLFYLYIDFVNQEKLLKYAIDYLSKYDSSKKNLNNVIKRKIYRLNITDLEKKNLLELTNNIISKLENNHLINDKKYSENKISSLSRSGKSKKFITNYLIKKGINSSQIEEDLKIFNQINEDWELNSAKLFAKKKRLFESDDTYEKKLAKLARAGFNYDICKKILS